MGTPPPPRASHRVGSRRADVGGSKRRSEPYKALGPPGAADRAGRRESSGDPRAQAREPGRARAASVRAPSARIPCAPLCRVWERLSYRRGPHSQLPRVAEAAGYAGSARRVSSRKAACAQDRRRWWPAGGGLRRRGSCRVRPPGAPGARDDEGAAAGLRGSALRPGAPHRRVLWHQVAGTVQDASGPGPQPDATLQTAGGPGVCAGAALPQQPGAHAHRRVRGTGGHEGLPQGLRRHALELLLHRARPQLPARPGKRYPGVSLRVCPVGRHHQPHHRPGLHLWRPARLLLRPCPRLSVPPWKRSVSAMGCLAPAPSAPVGRGSRSSGMWLLTSRPATCQPRK
nr:protein Wnt-11 isoform X2 [Peromyscus maniculatus bairdii]